MSPINLTMLSNAVFVSSVLLIKFKINSAWLVAGGAIVGVIAAFFL